jgi:hypothetical protein
MAYIQKNNPFKKKPEEPVDGGTLDEAEVLAFSSKKAERRYWREKDGIGANWNRWKKKRQERLNKPRTKRNWNL